MARARARADKFAEGNFIHNTDYEDAPVGLVVEDGPNRTLTKLENGRWQITYSNGQIAHSYRSDELHVARKIVSFPKSNPELDEFKQRVRTVLILRGAVNNWRKEWIEDLLTELDIPKPPKKEFKVDDLVNGMDLLDLPVGSLLHSDTSDWDIWILRDQKFMSLHGSGGWLNRLLENYTIKYLPSKEE